MGPRVHALLAAQHGLITFEQAIGGGLIPKQLASLLRSGRWVRVRPGVYTEGERWQDLDAYVGRRLLAVRAAHLVLRVPHWFSHDSAALLHGIGLLDLGRDPLMVHITRTEMRGRRTKAGVTHHGAGFDPVHGGTIDGLPVLGLTRTVLDLTREHPFDVGLGACDQALRRGITRAELGGVAEQMRGWPYSRRVREAVRLADEGAENPFESAGRSLLLELGLGVPQTQFGLQDADRLAYCDLRVGRHIFECDGRIKLVTRSRGGFASDEDPHRDLWTAKKRQDFVCGFKLGLSRITYADLGNGRAAARRRLRREYADTVARFGSSIDDLTPYFAPPRR